MYIKVISRRIFNISEKDNLTPLLKKLRKSAESEKGFISRTIYSSLNDPGEVIVISEWKNADNWIEWMSRKKVKKLQWKIDSLIGEKTFFDVYKPEKL